MVVSNIPSPPQYLPVVTWDFIKNDFCDEIREAIKAEFERFRKNELEEKLCSLNETSQILGVSKVTIRNWIKEGRLQEHRMGSRVYCKYSAIMNSLQTLKKYKKVL